MKNPVRAYSIEARSKRLGYIMLIPSAILIAVVSIYPLFYGVYLSFRNQHFLKPGRNDFVGLANYTRLFADSKFLDAIAYTLLYTLGVVLIAYAIGMAIALMLNKRIPLRGALRAMVLIPWIIPATVATTNWRWLLDTQVGFMNTALQAMGLTDKPIAFLNDPMLVKYTMIAFGIWKSFPYMVLTLLSGLQGIPDDIYEAATIDGANAWQTFRSITMALLKPVSFVALTLMCIWTFNNFENIYLFTEGGPRNYTTTISILTYKTAFFSSEISYACASGTSMMFFMAIFGIIYMRLMTGDDSRPAQKIRRGRR